ncbi:RHS repeat-associated core domain-containing protein [Pseudomonas corrugata]
MEAGYKTLRYSGQEMDASGLYYYGARYYAPWLQRWVSSDPAGDLDGLNLYGFVGNNPIIFTDFSGLMLETPAQRDARKALAATQLQRWKTLSRLNREVEKFIYIMKLTARRASEAQSTNWPTIARRRTTPNPPRYVSALTWAPRSSAMAWAWRWESGARRWAVPQVPGRHHGCRVGVRDQQSRERWPGLRPGKAEPELGCEFQIPQAGP